MSRPIVNRVFGTTVAQQSATTASSTVVVMLQLTPVQAAWQQHVYQLAVAKAKAALAPPRYVSRFLASWN